MNKSHAQRLFSQKSQTFGSHDTSLSTASEAHESWHHRDCSTSSFFTVTDSEFSRPVMSESPSCGWAPGEQIRTNGHIHQKSRPAAVRVDLQEDYRYLAGGQFPTNPSHAQRLFSANLKSLERDSSFLIVHFTGTEEAACLPLIIKLLFTTDCDSVRLKTFCPNVDRRFVTFGPGRMSTLLLLLLLKLFSTATYESTQINTHVDLPCQ